MDERPWIAHYDPRVPAEIAPVEAGVPAQVEHAVREFAARPALHFENRSWTYAELGSDIAAFARALIDLGAGPRTRVAIMLPNLPQTVIAYQAALRIGCEVVLTNPLYMDTEIEHQWNDSRCTLAIVADFLYAQKLDGLRSRLPIRTWVLARIPDALAFPLAWIAPFALALRKPPAIARRVRASDVSDFKDLLRAGARSSARLPAPPGLDELAVLQYTGGTTGRAKAAELTHRNIAVNIAQIGAWFPGYERGGEVCLACLPLFHVFGMTVGMNWSLTSGAAVVLVTDPRDVGRLMRVIARRRVTLFPAVPALFQAINGHAEVGRYDLSSLKLCISGSAPLSVEVMERFEERTGARIVEGYGLSETSPVTHVNPLIARKVGTIGVPLPSTRARVVAVDDPRRVLACGEEGELAVAGPQVMRGYWGRPDESAEVMRDGWFLTGDLGVQEAEGYFRIVGRKKDMINVSGFKVYPDEIDSLLLGLPQVLEAATIGVQRGDRESVKTHVVLRPGAKLTAAEVLAHCRAHLAAYKVPREVEFLPELPKSTVLKVLRRELRERDRRAGASGASS
jgi:long-chain acyl-CoA synthetase